jgi:hypothetical protein
MRTSYASVSKASIGKWSGIDWEKNFYPTCDPYFVWMDIANRLSINEKHLPVLLEMVEGSSVSELSTSDQLTAQPLFRSKPSRGDLPFRYGTAYASKEFFKNPTSFGVDRYVLGVPRIPIKNPVYVKPVLGENKEKPIVVVVDDGMPFLHQAYRTNANGSTRVREFQDLENPSKNLTRSQIVPYLNSNERLTYQNLGYDRVLYGASHGAHITDTAVGNGRKDAADAAELFVIQLPLATLTDSSGGGLAVHALDALVDTFFKIPLKNPVIACLSYGIHAGPHDGSSVLECAFDELLTMRNSSHLILPAGNNRQGKGHADFWIGKSPHELFWQILPQDQTDSYCEIWSQPLLKDATQIKVELIDPNNSSIAAESQSVVAFGSEERALPHAAIFLRKVSSRSSASIHSSQSTQFRWQVLICVRATQGEFPAPHGCWKIRISLIDSDESDNRIQCDAWIERDGAVFGADSGGQQSYFEDLPNSGVTDKGTMNGIATGRKVTVVSALVGSKINDGSGDAEADYSAQQSDSVKVSNHKSVIVDENFSGEGTYACGPINGERMRMSGSSVAAAIYTRRLYNDIASQSDAYI